MTRALLAAFAALALAACSDPPAPTASAPVPAAPETRAAAYAPWQWNDISGDPELAGHWTYTPLQGGYSSAAFGADASEAAFSLSCDHAARTLTLMRSNQLDPDQPTTLTLIIPAGRQDFPAHSYNEGLPHIRADAPAPDARLQAVAASAEGFAVEAGGDVTRLPADPMIARVLADCGRG